MINSYEEAVNYILDIPRFADKSGPENVKRLMKLLGHPENAFASIHIAGTNGKGSVARILAGTFYEAGYKTGLFVSPHLVRINERISINGADISDGDFLDCFNKVLDASEKLCEEGGAHPSFFEFVFAMGMVYFADANIDIAIIETGLGGRLDATNVITPIASVITSIGFDHMQYLGDTIEKIASEKAGIIKKNVPVIYNTGSETADRVIEKTAKNIDSPCINAGKTEIFDAKYRTDLPQIDFSVSNSYYKRIGVTINSTAYYEVINVVTAMETLRVIAKQFDAEAMWEAMRQSLKHFNLPGRMQYIEKNVILDGAHNENAIRYLGESLRRGNVKIKRLLLAVSSDKDYGSIAQSILKYIKPEEIYITETHGKRKLSKAYLAEAFSVQDSASNTEASDLSENPARIHLCQSSDTAYSEAKEGLTEEDILLVTGSFYLIGDIL